ncbi:MAG: hypothetical protein M0Z58_08540, partial [Nitrospiraceae bacterium]|nr:hypothetical protein [Nitrospiraceae bacterium]
MRGLMKAAPRMEAAVLIVFAVTILWAGSAFPAEGPGVPKLSLEAGLKMVTMQNRLIKIAQREEDVQKAQTRIARAPMLPSVDG